MISWFHYSMDFHLAFWFLHLQLKQLVRWEILKYPHQTDYAISAYTCQIHTLTHSVDIFCVCGAECAVLWTSRDTDSFRRSIGSKSQNKFLFNDIHTCAGVWIMAFRTINTNSDSERGSILVLSVRKLKNHKAMLTGNDVIKVKDNSLNPIHSVWTFLANSVYRF